MGTTREGGSKAKAAGWALMSVAAWSLIPMLASDTGTLSAGQFLFASHVVSTLTLGVFAVATGHAREFLSYSATDIRRLAALGGLGIFLYYALLYSAYTPCAPDAPCAQKATLVMVVHYSWPIATVVLSRLLLAEAPPWSAALSVPCGVLAVISAAAADSHGHIASSTMPKVVGAVAAFGLYSTLTKRVRYELFTGTTIMFAAAATLSLAAVVAPAVGRASATAPAIDRGTLASIVMSGMVVNGLSYVFWQRALRHVPEHVVAPWVSLTPLAAGAVFAMSTGAVPQPLQWVGLLLVLVSVYGAFHTAQPRHEAPPTARRELPFLSPDSSLAGDSV